MARTFNVPYIFTIKGIPPRCRDIREVDVYAMAAFSIPELTEGEAPLAMQWTDRDGQVCQTRWHDESHWVPYKPYIYIEDRYRDSPLSGDEIEAAIAGKDTYTPFTAKLLPRKESLRSGAIPLFDPSNYRSLNVMDRDEQFQEIRDNFKNAILVEDELWVRSTEPVYVLDRRGYQRDTIYAEVKPVGEVSTRKRNVFNALNIEIAENIAREYFGENSIFNAESKIDIFIPESIRYDGETEAYLEEIQSYLEVYAKDLSKYSTDEIRLWCDLKDLKIVADKSRISEDLAQLEYHIDNVLNFNTEGYFLDKLKEAQNRWRDRPISISDFDIDIGSFGPR